MKPFALFATFAALVSPLSAAIVITGDVATPGAPCTLTITEDIVSQITQDPLSPLLCLVLDNWVTTDGLQHFVTPAQDLAVAVNGGPTFTLGSMLADNYADTNLPDMTVGDGYLYVYLEPMLEAGDTFTIKAGSYTFAGVAGMNPQIAQTFNGNFFITDETGTRIGDIVNLGVPEPSAALLGSLGILALLKRRK